VRHEIAQDEITYPHVDHLGSPVAATTESGTLLWRERYTPFGEKRSQPKGNIDSQGYTGHIEDTKLGLTYMQARFYDPVVGRFYSNDPVDFQEHLQRGNIAAHGFGRYTYANNNPYKYTDPDGEFGVVGALVGAALDAGMQVANGMQSGQSLKESVKNIDLGSVAVSAALGSVGGGATILLKGAATGTTKVAGVTINLTTKTERVAAGTIGASQASAVGAAQAGRKGENMAEAAAVAVANGVTSPVPSGTIVSKGIDLVQSTEKEEAETRRDEEHDEEVEQ